MALATNHQWDTTKDMVDLTMMIKDIRVILIILVEPVDIPTRVVAIEDATPTTTTTSTRTSTILNNTVAMEDNRMEWDIMGMDQVEWETHMVCNIKEVWEVAAFKTKTIRKEEKVPVVETARSSKVLLSWVVSSRLAFNNKVVLIPHLPVAEAAGQTKAVVGVEVAKVVDGKETRLWSSLTYSYILTSAHSQLLKTNLV